jgi:hypothetical protein
MPNPSLENQGIFNNISGQVILQIKTTGRDVFVKLANTVDLWG